MAELEKEAMNKITQIVFTAVLAFLLGSCGLFNSVSEQTEDREQIVAEETGEEIPETEGEGEGEGEGEEEITKEGESGESESAPTPQAQTFSNPSVQPAPPKPPRVANLIPNTNPSNRLDQVDKGRSDPFALIPVPEGDTVVRVEPTGGGATVSGGNSSSITIPSTPTLISPNNGRDRATNNPTIPSQRNFSNPPISPSADDVAINSGDSLPDVRQSPLEIPSILPTDIEADGSDRFLPQLPPPPQPTLAQAVEVTGVIKIRGVVHAIVKAPNEPFSRYVKAGQYLSGGQVLVKRINMNAGPEPVVVLEQLGIEVSRGVGEPALTQNARDSAANLPETRVSFGQPHLPSL